MACFSGQWFSRKLDAAIFRGLSILILCCYFGPMAEAGCREDEAGAFDSTQIDTVLEGRLLSLFSCFDRVEQGDADDNDAIACNWFVGKAVHEVWGLRDFYANGRYMNTSQLAGLGPDGLVALGWTSLGNANNQQALADAERGAHNGSAVIAIGAGHVSLVLPGGLARSGTWNLNVPRAAQFSLHNLSNSWVGCRMSRGWGVEKIAGVELFYKDN